jgi:hypothetical protein
VAHPAPQALQPAPQASPASTSKIGGN